MISLVVATTWPVPGNAATEDQKDSLHGLTGVRVKRLEFTSFPTRLTAEIPVEELAASIKKQLQSAGIRVLDDVTSKDDANAPYLFIHGAVSQIAANYYAYTVLIDLYQPAALSSGGNSSWVVTWSSGALSTGDVLQIQQRIQLLVDLFIEDFQAINHPSRPVARLQLVMRE